MNLIEESFRSKEEKKKKNTTRIILVAIILVVILMISIFAYLMYIQSTIMTVTIDGKANEKLKQILVFEEDGTIYAPIKEIAPYFGYESYNGESTEKSEVQSKCYIQNENEIVDFELGKNKIYKLDLNRNDGNYEDVYIKKPIKAINGVLYISTEGLEKAFNLSFDYNQEKNAITIWTMSGLYQYYSSIILDYGYAELKNEFVNQKSLFANQLIVLKNTGKKQYGVIGTDGTVILEPKYDNITYLPNTGDFLVEDNKKVGIISASRETKVELIYDSLELMDNNSGLYVAKNENKYGIIDTKGNIKVHIENDEIGIDISPFTKNNIKNKYIMIENLIPIKKDGYWGLFDKSGKQVVEFKYDSLGYVTNNSREAYNLLVIPNYEVLVACKDKKYTLLNSSGTELFATVADDIYMAIESGERHYYISVNDQKINAEEWLDRNGITAKNSNQAEKADNKNTEEENNETEVDENSNQATGDSNNETSVDEGLTNINENNNEEENQQGNEDENNQEEQVNE